MQKALKMKYFSFRASKIKHSDISPAGDQPMTEAEGRYWIAFNGEIYNYLELRSQLSDLGHEFHTDTDTEVILAAFKEWGRLYKHFNGDWAFLIFDNLNETLLSPEIGLVLNLILLSR